jgi:hypothetical protein
MSSPLISGEFAVDRALTVDFRFDPHINTDHRISIESSPPSLWSFDDSGSGDL